MLLAKTNNPTIFQERAIMFFPGCLLHAFTASHLEYCDLLHSGLPLSLLDPFISMQNPAVKIVYLSSLWSCDTTVSMWPWILLISVFTVMHPTSPIVLALLFFLWFYFLFHSVLYLLSCHVLSWSALIVQWNVVDSSWSCNLLSCSHIAQRLGSPEPSARDWRLGEFRI